MANVFAAKTATVGFNGRSVVIRRGEAWDADDQLVAAYPDLFVAEATDVRSTRAVPTVEAATANPGEKRSTRRGSPRG